MITPSASVFPVSGSLSGAGGLDEIQTIANRAQNGVKMSDEELQKVGQKFEALLLNNLLSAMRKSIPENPLFGESHAQKMYWEMFDESMAESAAVSSSTGITQAIVEELKRQSEQVTPPAGDNPFRSLAAKSNQVLPIHPPEAYRSIPRDHESFEPIKEHEETYRPIPGRASSIQ